MHKQLKESIQKTNPARASVEYILPKQGKWRQFIHHASLQPYQRLFTLVIIANLLILYLGMADAQWWQGTTIDLLAIAKVTLVNFTLAILIRQQYLINTLYWLASRVPLSFPLSIRWASAKVYHFGGLHSGAAFAGTIWFIVLLASMTIAHSSPESALSQTTLFISGILLIILLGICAAAIPAFRMKKHNIFERVHRFGGWSALILFWGLDYSLAHDFGTLTLGKFIDTTANTGLLALITVSIILPWLRLKKVAIEALKPSPHAAITRFSYGVKPHIGSFTTISRNPLLEWHSFANIPAPDQSGYRLAISRAGDWTGNFIDNTPTHVWVKGIPTTGVGNIDQLFRRVVWLATGSGIGPVLPHILAGNVPSTLVWSTRAPRKTYGEDLIEEILVSVPDALIWDTDDKGRPDLVQLAYSAYRNFNAEAVIVISNKKLTNMVVHAMESRGIPAFGAIWDS